MRELVEWWVALVRRLRVMAARATFGPMLVRLAIWLAAFAALVLAYPVEVSLQRGGVLSYVVVAALPMLAPRTRMVSIALFLAIFGWIMSTGFYGERITVLRLVGLGAALYLTHTSAALAAVLPYDTVVSPGVLGGWALRALGVLAVTALFALAAIRGASLFGGRTFLFASLAGVASVCVLGWLLARAVRR